MCALDLTPQQKRRLPDWDWPPSPTPPPPSPPWWKRPMFRQWVKVLALLAIPLSATTLLVSCNKESRGSAANPSDKKDSSSSPDLIKDVYVKPVLSEAPEHSSVITAKAYDEKIASSLAVIQKRLNKATLTLGEKSAIKGDVRKTIDLLLPLADDARNDIDTVIRVAEDIKFELQFAQKQHQATAEFFRARSNATTTDELRSINMQTAEWFDTLAADVPRRQKLTDEFLAELAVMRREVTETTRMLQDLRTAIIATEAGPDPLKLSLEGQTFQRQIEKFMDVLTKFHKAFRVGGGGKEP